MSQIVSVHVGQCGVQLAEAVWELSRLEHSLGFDGAPLSGHEFMENPQIIYNELSTNKYVPRSLLIDTDRGSIEDFQHTAISKMFNKRASVGGKEDTANNFERGYYTIGKQLMVESVDKIMHEVEKCDNLEGLIFYGASSGGTGSALSSLILSQLSFQVPKKIVVSNVVFPSINFSDTPVSPYNTVRNLTSLFQYNDITLCYDNQSLYKIFEQKLDIDDPNYRNINALIAQVPSALTVGTRFGNGLRFTLRELAQNLVPYPRFHFIVPSFSPFIRQHQYCSEKDLKNINEQVFNDDCQFFLQNIFSKSEPIHYNLSCSMILRGSNYFITDIRQTIQKKIDTRTLKFINWAKTSLKVCNTYFEPKHIKQTGIGHSPRTVTLLSNNLMFKDFLNRLAEKFDRMYSKRAMVHWYVGEGASGDLPCDRQQIAALIRDYQEIEEQHNFSEESSRHSAVQ